MQEVQDRLNDEKREYRTVQSTATPCIPENTALVKDIHRAAQGVLCISLKNDEIISHVLILYMMEML